MPFSSVGRSVSTKQAVDRRNVEGRVGAAQLLRRLRDAAERHPQERFHRQRGRQHHGHRQDHPRQPPAQVWTTAIESLPALGDLTDHLSSMAPLNTQFVGKVPRKKILV